MNACIGPISTPENSFQTTSTSGMGAISLDGEEEEHPSGEDVAEESEGEGERLDQLLDDVEQHHGLERLQIVAEVAPQALFANPGHVHENDDEERERGGEIEVRRGRWQVLR